MNKYAEKLKEIDSSLLGRDRALNEMKTQFDYLVSMQKQERAELQKLCETKIDRIQKHCERVITSYKNLTYCLVGLAVICLAILVYVAG